jgi:hypothetical protein
MYGATGDRIKHFRYYCGLLNEGYAGLFSGKRPAERDTPVCAGSEIAPVRHLAGLSTSSLAAVVLVSTFLVSSVSAQVFVVGKEQPKGVPVFKPTSVALAAKPITALERQQLIVSIAAEQGFAMRPLPLGTPGLMLHANGALKFGRGDYYDSLTTKGISSKAGDRLLITDFLIDKNKIVIEFNGGPEKKHKILRHISVGADPNNTTPIVADNGVEPTGSRLTLVFDKFVPELTGDDLRALIEPVIDFRIKSQIEIYADTLPPKLKAAILNHQALVGMDRKMVTYALGQPEQKIRERDGDTPFEEWIYGSTPNPIQFVRFTSNRVTRIELALYGKSPTIRNQDETDGYLAGHPTRTVAEGDVVLTADGDKPKSQPPSLRLPGEAPPQNQTSMQPVHNPTDPVKPSPLPEAPNQQMMD